MVILSGPSGVGKDSVLRALKGCHLPFHFVVTANTRPPRPDEEEGVDYFFVTRERFENMIVRDELIEYAHVYGDYKGIPRDQIAQAIASDKDIIMRLDVQGAERMREMYPEAILVFLLPEDEQSWLNRLSVRGNDPSKDYELRRQTVAKELEKVAIFDYLVINADNRLQQAVDSILEIIRVEHLRVHHRTLTPKNNAKQ